MNRILAFRPDLQVHRTGDTVFIISERGRRMLRGKGLAEVVSLLDGERSVGDIAQVVAAATPLHEVFYVVDRLTEEGYLLPATGNEPDPAVNFWSACVPREASRGYDPARDSIRIVALNGRDTTTLASALGLAGLNADPTGDLAIVPVTDYLDPAIDEFAARAARDGLAWMPIKDSGITVWFGPLIGAGGVPCWECLAHRLRFNHPIEAHLRARCGFEPTPRSGHLPATKEVAHILAALEIAKAIRFAETGSLARTLFTLDLDQLALVHHAVVRRPQCPACGDPDLFARQLARPVRLQPSEKTFTGDGGHRTAAPGETFARLRHHVSPITGVVSSLGPVPGRDHHLRPVFGSSWFAHPIEDPPEPDQFHRTGMGKGRSPAQARTSALCEAIERWSAAFQGDEPSERAAFEDLGEAAVHPSDLLLYSESQLDGRPDVAGRARDRALRVPPRLAAGRAIHWTPVWSLTRERRRQVPSSYCFADMPAPPGERVCPYDSNGDAAGNCLEEAVLQGFMELVERDAAALWWYSRARRPGVDLHSFGDPYFSHLIEHFASLGWDLWVLDITTDLAIPSFVAYARSEDGRRFSAGFGTHFDARLAAQRALTELNQIFDPAGRHPLPWNPDDIEHPEFLLPDDATAPVSVEAFPHTPSDDLADDVMRCVRTAERAGLETLVLDRTRPDVDLTVVKVIVPGLRHFWPRLGPGRLYDVPPRLGWIEARLTEERLNPVPLAM